jgi:methyl-accepting chemotaxis protein
MMHLIFRSLMGKLVLLVVLVALIPIGVVGYISYRSASKALINERCEMLTAIGDEKASQLQAYFRDAVATIGFLGQYQVKSALDDLKGVQSGAGKENGSAQNAGERAMLSLLTAQLDGILAKYLKAEGNEFAYQDILLLKANGDIIYSVTGTDVVGTNAKSENIANTGLGKVWSEVAESRETVLTDFSPYGPEGRPAAFIGSPVISEIAEEFIGLVVIQMGPERIDDIMRLSPSAGKTTEAYLVGADNLMRTRSKFIKGSTFLSKKVLPEHIGSGGRDTKNWTAVRGYRGVPVFNSQSKAGLKSAEHLRADFDWKLLVSIDRSEVIEPARILGLRVLLIALGVALIVACLGFFLARRIAKPVAAITDVVRGVSEGDLTVVVPELETKDEIGILGEASRKMVTHTREQISRVTDGVHVLTSSATEISTAVTQLTDSTQQTSSSVVETGVTVDQVREAAELMLKKVDEVTRISQEAVSVFLEGKEATDDTVEKMKLIEEQMISIAETVVKLSQRSEAMEEIIDSVQDLADQSNLLAVNASIEASRAGEQGKGFAVVAQEIKNLADGSKAATGEIREILGEITKWVRAVSMASEKGRKAVDAGVEQSIRAGQSISVLSGNVESSSQAANIIKASVEQQFAGVEQVAQAMSDIQDSVRQNLSGAEKLEEASKQLAELGAHLSELVERYKL